MWESNFGAKKINTAADLRDKYLRDKDYVPTGSVRGLSCNQYRQITDKLDGLKDGMMIIIAKSNIGKTTLCLSMAVDLLSGYVGRDDAPRVVVYTFDDNKETVIEILVSSLSDMTRNTVDRSRHGDDYKEQVIKKSYDILAAFADNDQFEIVSEEEIATWGDFMADIYRQHNINNKCILFIDGISQLEYDKDTKRLEKNEAKSIDLKKIANELKIPIVITQEPPKLCPVRPTKEDIAETRRWGFDAKVVLAMSDVDDLCREQSAESGETVFPEIVVSVEKNKWSSFKGYFFGRLLTNTSKIGLLPHTPEMKKRKIDYELGKKPKEK